MMTLSLFLVKGLIVLSVAALCSLLLRGRSAVLRDRVWTLAFVALLLLPLAPLVLPGWSVPVPELPRYESAGTVPAGIEPSPSAGVIVVPVQRNTSAPSPAPLADPRILASLFVGIWVLGVFLFGARLGFEFLSLWRCRRDARRVDPRIERVLRRCAMRLGIGKLPDTRLHGQVTIPLVIGIGRSPAILLPQSAIDWSEQRLESVLLHEMAHIRRRDPLVALVSAIACTLHWVNPLAWWAARRASADREEACDMMVLSGGADRYHYAQDLLDTARVIAGSPQPSIAPHMASAASLRQRIEALLSNRTPVAELGRRTSRVTSIIALSALLPIACAKVAEPGSDVAFGNSSTDYLLDASAPVDARLRAIWQLGDEENGDATGALVQALDDEDPAMRGMSAWALGEIKDIDALDALIRAMDDEDPVAREMVIRAIGEMDDPRSVETLIAAAASESDVHRAAAVRALSDLSWSYDARRAVESALGDPSPLVRKSAVMALGESETDEGLTEALISLLNDDAAEVRALTAHTLGIIGDPRAIDALIAASRDINPEVRTWTVWALDEINREDRH